MSDQTFHPREGRGDDLAPDGRSDEGNLRRDELADEIGAVPPVEEPDEDLERLLGSEDAHLLRSPRTAPVIPRALENRVVSALRREGLIVGGVRPGWVRPTQFAAMAAALLVSFALGIEFGRRTTPEPKAVVAPEPEPASDSEALMMTQFHMDGTDPLQHYSEAEDHPRNKRVLIKTWEY